MNTDNIKQVFFDAMKKGYANGAQGAPIISIPGSTKVEFKSNHWRVIDMWVTNVKSHRSTGQTLIYYNKDLVWHMSYEGWYEKSVLGFLKNALYHTYKSGEFFGCRGPVTHQEPFGGFVYSNSWKGDFSEFSGFEKIRRNAYPDSEVLGTHSYRGGVCF